MTHPDKPDFTRPFRSPGYSETQDSRLRGCGGPAGSELPPVLTGCRCKCGAAPVRVDGVLKLDCGCKR